MCLQLCHKEEGGDGGQSSKRNNAPCDLHNPIAHCLRNTLVTPDYIIMNRYLLEVDKCSYVPTTPYLLSSGAVACLHFILFLAAIIRVLGLVSLAGGDNRLILLH